MVQTPLDESEIEKGRSGSALHGAAGTSDRGRRACRRLISVSRKPEAGWSSDATTPRTVKNGNGEPGVAAESELSGLSGPHRAAECTLRARTALATCVRDASGNGRPFDPELVEQRPRSVAMLPSGVPDRAGTRF